ncbi:hypothetical protein P4369_19345, partial [Bacillus thuringiensis]|nr:hypothetical protein [Bacillus thuringiensis]
MDGKILIQTLLYGINQLATKQVTQIDAGKDILISSMKILDIGKEMVIPKLFQKEASATYNINNNRVVSDMSLLSEVLTAFLRKKKELIGSSRIDSSESFKYRRNTGTTLPLQFHDFFIVEQAYMYSLAYLDSSDDYAYEYDGLIELGALVAIYLFENMTRQNEYYLHDSWGNMDENPGGLYKFKSNTNVKDYIESIIEDIEGIDE